MGQKEIHFRCEKLNKSGHNLCIKGSEVFEPEDVYIENHPCILDTIFPLC
jgi:hypothetical protein